MEKDQLVAATAMRSSTQEKGALGFYEYMMRASIRFRRLAIEGDAKGLSARDVHKFSAVILLHRVIKIEEQSPPPSVVDIFNMTMRRVYGKL